MFLKKTKGFDWSLKNLNSTAVYTTWTGDHYQTIEVFYLDFLEIHISPHDNFMLKMSSNGNPNIINNITSYMT